MTIRAQALTTFHGDYGQIRTGQIFICEDNYFLGLKQRKMAIEAPPLKTLSDPGDPPKKESSPQLPPGENTDPLAADPQSQPAADLQGPSPSPAPSAGQGRPSSASRRGRRLSNQT